MTLEGRKQILADILKTIRQGGYHYDLAKGGISASGLFPPPANSFLNCRSAAWVFLKHAQNAHIDRLQAVFYSNPKGGFLVMDSGMYTASAIHHRFGARPLTVGNLTTIIGSRTLVTGTVYDPTFGTASSIARGNPVGVQATSEIADRQMNMTSVYGTRYEVVRRGGQCACRELNHNLVPPAYIIDDAKFAVTNLSV